MLFEYNSNSWISIFLFDIANQNKHFTMHEYRYYATTKYFSLLCRNDTMCSDDQISCSNIVFNGVLFFIWLLYQLRWDFMVYMVEEDTLHFQRSSESTTISSSLASILSGYSLHPNPIWVSFRSTSSQAFIFQACSSSKSVPVGESSNPHQHGIVENLH